ncbi:DUF6082 family protein [Streptomyces chiangmaiensis]|uniref:DUF6082 family protein n=1 Tax=Streptomyces chiangmaiensis TaxID=766497 RepID=A0ABU7FJQ1_9ACTN|nr:DUF6082 family protein [Streptomyces chiangmaiensis]MED7823867.1 DUF6082 family protein [Streptomyces chiangmaiensis]
MARDTGWRTPSRIAGWLIASVTGIALVGALSIVASGWLIDGVERTNGSRQTAAARSALGDYFGAVSAVFSGVALLLLVTTLIFQQRELRLQRQELALQREELVASRDELRRSAAADLRSLHVRLTEMQMADPALAEVWNAYPGRPHSEVRQFLFANLTWGQYLLLYEWGGLTESELLAHARRITQSSVFRRYWNVSREAKASLPPESTEGRFFRIFERAMNDHQSDSTASTS